jgi:hypothetical protein
LRPGRLRRQRQGARGDRGRAPEGSALACLEAGGQHCRRGLRAAVGRRGEPRGAHESTLAGDRAGSGPQKRWREPS